MNKVVSPPANPTPTAVPAADNKPKMNTAEEAETAAKKPKKSSAFDAGSRALIVRFFHEWIAPRWRELLIALGLTALLAAVTGGYPMVIKLSFDTLMAEGDSNAGSSVMVVFFVIIAITFARSILLYFQTVRSIGLVQRLSTDLQKHAFTHAVNADFASQTREGPGRMVSKLTNDIQFVQNAVQSTLNTAVRDVMMVIALVISMIWLDPLMTFFVLCVYPIAAIPIAIISERLRRVAKRTQNELGGMTSLLTEKLSGARLIKMFRLENYATSQVHTSFEDVYKLRMKAVRNRARLDPMLEALGGLAVAGVIVFAYWRISSGGATVGDFMGFITALLMAAQPIRGLGNLTGKVQEGLAAAESIYSLLDEEPKITDRPNAKPLLIDAGAIEFKNVSFDYQLGGTQSQGAAGGAGTEAIAPPTLQDISLSVPGGQTIAIVGPSGAGKSTILNLVPRLFDVTGGTIEIDGQPIRDVTLASLRDQIAIVSQDVTLFDDTIGANIALGRLDAPQSDIEAAAEAAAAHDFILAQPDGYQTQIGDRGLRLSGGQRQRLALARAILKDAPILLLDEATSALDTESERLVQQALAAFTQNRTTLVIAHRLSTVQNADLICVMDAGRVVELGTHSDLMAKNGLYASLARSQDLGATQ